MDSLERSDEQSVRHVKSRYSIFSHVYDVMEWPLERWAYRLWREQLWSEVPPGNILEAGAGTGKNIPYYRSDMHITAIDLTPAMFKHYKSRIALSDSKAEKIDTAIMDVQHLEYADDTFDAAVATFIFCSVPDPVKGLKELLRVVKPGGTLHLLEHMTAESPRVSKVMKRLDPSFHYLTGVHIARATVENVCKAGWEIVEVKSLVKSGIFKRITAEKR